MLPMSSASKNLPVTTPRGDVRPKKAHIGPRALCCCAARPGRAVPKSWLRGPLAALRKGQPPPGARSERKWSNSANRMSSGQAGSVWPFYDLASCNTLASQAAEQNARRTRELDAKACFSHKWRAHSSRTMTLVAIPRRQERQKQCAAVPAWRTLRKSSAASPDPCSSVS